MYIFYIYASFPTGCGSPNTILSTLTCSCVCITKRGNEHQSNHIFRVSFPVDVKICIYIYIIFVGWQSACMCFHLFFPKVLFNSAFFISGLLLNVSPSWLPPQKALCSSHDFAVRVETSTDGCGNAGCTQQTLGGEPDGMWVVGMWVFQREATGCWCSVKSTRRCFE